MSQSLTDSSTLTAGVRHTSGLRHDLANYISVVLGQSHWLLQQPNLSREVADAAETVLATAEVMRGLLEDTAMFYLHKQLEICMDHFRGIYAQEKVNFELVALSQPLVVSGSSGQFQRVMHNCIENSIRALAQMPSQHQRKLIISVIKPRIVNRGWVVIEIADTGCGMLPQQLEKIFLPGFTTKKAVGAGQGLWISKTIMERDFRGKITVQSKWQQGTQVQLHFPVSRVEKFSAVCSGDF